MDDCSNNIDPNKLVREGTDQDQRRPPALDPSDARYARVDERTLADRIVFARGYAALLNDFDENDAVAGDWAPFFGKDVAFQLAVFAIEDIESYKASLKSWFDFLNELDNKAQTQALKNRLSFLFGSLASLAKQLDLAKDALPEDIPLKNTLSRLIEQQLAPAFARLIAYYKAGAALNLVGAATPPPVLVLRAPVAGFEAALAPAFLSELWSGGVPWGDFVSAIVPDANVYGTVAGVFNKINHCATHNLFTAIFDVFLKGLARLIKDAENALADNLANWDRHEPHYALFLSFLQLFEYVRTATNTLTERHLDFYFRQILRLKEKPAEPGHVHLLVELAKQASSYEFKPDVRFKAGKDAQGHPVFFANDADFVANQAQVAALQTVYRYRGEPAVSPALAAEHNEGRWYAAPVANSDDGRGAPLTTVDQSWQPFFNKGYVDGVLTEIRMPTALVGFAIASHHLLLAEGKRIVTVAFELSQAASKTANYAADIVCLLTAEKGWHPLATAAVTRFDMVQNQKKLTLEFNLSGGEPAIVPFNGDVHGHALKTDLPVLMVQLRQQPGVQYRYPDLRGLAIKSATLTVDVTGVKTLAVNNDFGPIDGSKPYQPFGPLPVNGSHLVIGSKEIFQKSLVSLNAEVQWQLSAVAYTTSPKIKVQLLAGGNWQESGLTPVLPTATSINLFANVAGATMDGPDFARNDVYATSARNGFVRLSLTEGLGQDKYQAAVIKYLVTKLDADKPGNPPVAPVVAELKLNYKATTTLSLGTPTQTSYDNRKGRFFHLAPFGYAEQHPHLSTGNEVPLLPQFRVDAGAADDSEAEFYIGIRGLAPPQNLSLLFQVADGTANPLAPKPELHWSYLKNNRWVGFADNEVVDGTRMLLASGIITFAVPRGANADNTLLPSGMVWLRAAVRDDSDAVCRLQRVAAQALRATFVDQGNVRNFSATPLAAETIGKLEFPQAAVKSVSQPFASFDGRGVEETAAFYTRASERLRHKDRAIGLWDYERLILEAFPQIYKAKCLNHTQYEPSAGNAVYRERAPGHVTVVTLPKLHRQTLRDPLKPFTSLGLLDEIKAFLRTRVSCFTQLHVCNPQFEEIWVRFKLSLRAGSDWSYHSEQLRQAITRFLSPWAFVEGGSPSFGGKIYKSALINFVEDQPYVDYVTDFQLFRGLGSQTDLDAVEGSTAVSILVSAAASRHQIQQIVSAADTALDEDCSCEP